jgi:solute carrier family 26 (sodium-independent sulfate anion transporter), member 11
MSKYVEGFKNGFVNDHSVRQTRYLAVKGARAVPGASIVYLKDKVPIVGWLPRYNYRWLVNDVVAGLTLGLMLIPQSLAYAKIATIPVQYGLMAAWLPASLYAFMGTTKGKSSHCSRKFCP